MKQDLLPSIQGTIEESYLHSPGDEPQYVVSFSESENDTGNVDDSTKIIYDMLLSRGMLMFRLMDKWNNISVYGYAYIVLIFLDYILFNC